MWYRDACAPIHSLANGMDLSGVGGRWQTMNTPSQHVVQLHGFRQINNSFFLWLRGELHFPPGCYLSATWHWWCICLAFSIEANNNQWLDQSGFSATPLDILLSSTLLMLSAQAQL